MLYLYNVYHVMKVYHFSIIVEEHIMMFYPLDISLYFFSNCFFSSVCTFLGRGGGGSGHPFHFLISIIFYIKNSLSLSTIIISFFSLYISMPSSDLLSLSLHLPITSLSSHLYSISVLDSLYFLSLSFPNSLTLSFLIYFSSLTLTSFSSGAYAIICFSSSGVSTSSSIRYSDCLMLGTGRRRCPSKMAAQQIMIKLI